MRRIIVHFVFVGVLFMAGMGVWLHCTGSSPVWTNPLDGMNYMKIPAGALQATITGTGNTDSMVVINFPDGFLMSQTEVSVGQFRRFVDATGYITEAERANNRLTWKAPGFDQTDLHPVVFVSFIDARAYTHWAGCDLPTEAEWIYACRAGTNTKYFWGDSLNDEYLWHRQNTRGTGTRPVGTKIPNPWGLTNMAGNVREYVKVYDQCYAIRGSSWTRCPSYKTRLGSIASDLIAGSMAPRLAVCQVPENLLYPWDDDRGFRCVVR